ncbi:MAG: hypothetical protein ABI832_13465 [bacterium]
MRNTVHATLLASAMLAVLAAPTLAATCADHTHVVTQLQARFGEVLAYTGMARNDYIVEIFASKVTDRWTLTVATPDGLSCLLATGNGTEDLAALIGGSGRVALN